MTRDLAAWLLEQLAQDEQVIRRNLGRSGLGDHGSFPDYRTYDGADIDAADEYLEHFRPPRLLAECDAKRRVIARYESSVTDGAMMARDDVLRLLAEPYRIADRPGYREEWRP